MEENRKPGRPKGGGKYPWYFRLSITQEMYDAVKDAPNQSEKLRELIEKGMNDTSDAIVKLNTEKRQLQGDILYLLDLLNSDTFQRVKEYSAGQKIRITAIERRVTE